MASRVKPSIFTVTPESLPSRSRTASIRVSIWYFLATKSRRQPGTCSRIFDHALILRQDDPLLPAVLEVYEKQGIKDGHPQNTMKGEAFKTELATAYPDCRLVVTKETMTVEGMIKIVYELLKDKLNIAKITFTSGVNAASAEFDTTRTIDRCPLCGIALDANGVCPKCGYSK